MAKKKIADKDRIWQTALVQAGRLGWDKWTFQSVAKAIKLPLATIHTHYKTKADVVTAFSEWLTGQMLKHGSNFTKQDSEKDKLFDILMVRYENMQPWKPGVVSLLQSAFGDPSLLCKGLQSGHVMSGWVLQATDVQESDLKRELKRHSIMIVYLYTLRAWMRDDTPDLSKTMACLDGALQQHEAIWSGRHA